MQLICLSKHFHFSLLTSFLVSSIFHQLIIFLSLLQVYSKSISESLPPNSQILKVSALDLDATSKIEYRLPSSHNLPFKINPTTGQLTNSQILDFETAKNYDFQVFASDGLYFDAADVSIQILNENDNLPEIEVNILPKFREKLGSSPNPQNQAENQHQQNQQVILLDENLPKNTLLATVRISDEDLISENSTFQNSNFLKNVEILPKSTPFKLIPRQKSLPHQHFYTLTTTQTFDFENYHQKFYNFKILVCDHGANSQNSKTSRNTKPNCQTSKLQVKIQDLNDHQPTCASQLQIFSVPENLQVGNVVGKFRFIDMDSEKFQPKLSMSENSNFEINSAGDIILVKNLDYETRKNYDFLVTIDDGFLKPTTCKILINVSDVNDNSPEFLSPFGKLVIPSPGNLGSKSARGSSCPSSKTVKILAQDADSAASGNGKIHFSLLSHAEFFEIDQTTGHLKIKNHENLVQSLSQNNPQTNPESFMLKILATDDGENSNYSKIEYWLELSSDSHTCFQFIELSQESSAKLYAPPENFQNLEIISIFLGILLVVILLLAFVLIYVKKKHSYGASKYFRNQMPSNGEKRYSIASYKTKSSLTSSNQHHVSGNSSKNSRELTTCTLSNSLLQHSTLKHAHSIKNDEIIQFTNPSSEDGFFSQENRTTSPKDLDISQIGSNLESIPPTCQTLNLNQSRYSTSNNNIQNPHSHHQPNSSNNVETDNFLSPHHIPSEGSYTINGSKTRTSSITYTTSHPPNSTHHQQATHKITIDSSLISSEDHVIEVTDTSLQQSNSANHKDVIIMYDKSLGLTLNNHSSHSKLIDENLVKKTLKQQGQLQKLQNRHVVKCSSSDNSTCHNGHSSDTSGKGDSSLSTSGQSPNSGNNLNNRESDTGNETQTETVTDFHPVTPATKPNFTNRTCSKECLKSGHSDSCWMKLPAYQNPAASATPLKLSLLKSPDINIPENQIKNFKRNLKIRNSFNGFSYLPNSCSTLHRKIDLNLSEMIPEDNALDKQQNIKSYIDSNSGLRDNTRRCYTGSKIGLAHLPNTRLISSTGQTKNASSQNDLNNSNFVRHSQMYESISRLKPARKSGIISNL